MKQNTILLIIATLIVLLLITVCATAQVEEPPLLWQEKFFKSINFAQRNLTFSQIPLGPFSPSMSPLPKLKANHPNKHISVELSEIQTFVEISVPSFTSKTTSLLTFKNQNYIQLEGELEFPLAPGSIVTNYGLDVDGVIVDAVPISKQDARRIFEAEVNKQIDPGLIEHVKDNIFKTRVYPLWPKGQRQVKIEYQSELISNEAQDVIYWLPLGTEALKNANLQLFTFEVTVKGLSSVQSTNTLPFIIIVNGKGELKELSSLSRSSDGSTFSFAIMSDSLTNQTDPLSSTCGIIVFIPKADSKEPTVLVEIDSKNRTFFAIKDFVEMEEASPSRDESTSQETKKYPSIGIIWDSSLSRMNQEEAIHRELEMLQFILLENLQSTPFTVHTALLRFELEQTISFQCSDANSIEKVINYLTSVVYDGATSIASAQEFYTRNHDSNIVLFFTDGASTFNMEQLNVSKFSKLTHVIATNSSNAADLQNLLLIAQEKNGQLFTSLENLADEIFSPLHTNFLHNTPFSFIKAEVGFPNTLYDIMAGNMNSVFNQVEKSGRFIVIGRVNECSTVDKVTVTLCYGFSQNLITRKSTFTLHLKNPILGNTLNTFWASKKLHTTSDYQEIYKLGMEFSVVTPYTSLLVLESLQQHIQYDVTPAKTRVKMYEQFMEHKQRNMHNKENELETKIGQLVKYWKDYLNWYNTSFSETPFEDWFNDVALNTKIPSHEFIHTDGEYIGRFPIEWDWDGDYNGTPQTPIESDYTPNPSTSSYNPNNKNPKTEAKEGLVYKNTSKSNKISNSSSIHKSDCFYKKFLEFQEGKLTQKTIVAPVDLVNQTDLVSKNTSITHEKNDYTTSLLNNYLTQRNLPHHKNSPIFYHHFAQQHFFQKDNDLYFRVLSNVIELCIKNKDEQSIRTIAYRLISAHRFDVARHLLELAFQWKPRAPESFRDLALVYTELKQFNKALEMYWKLLTEKLDRAANMVSLLDFLRIVKLVQETKEYIPTIFDERILSLVSGNESYPLDLRVVYHWDIESPIEMLVLEPFGTILRGYQRSISRIGGRLQSIYKNSKEQIEYSIKNARPGKYFFKVKNVISPNMQTVLCIVYKNFGTEKEEREYLTLFADYNKSNGDRVKVIEVK